MADNIQLNTGSGGDLFAADDISGVKYQRTKLTIGDDGANDGDVSEGNPLPAKVCGPLTAFGEVSVANPSPEAQIDFVHGVNTYTTNQSTTGSGSVSAASGILTVDTTATASSTAELSSARYISYRAGQGVAARFTAAFTSGAADSKQYAGVGQPGADNGFLFGFNGTSFGIASVTGGTEAWVPQASWNVDVCDGTGRSGFNIDETKLNVFEIKYQYLGAGNIFFGIEDPDTGRFIIVHTIKYANTAVVPSIRQPSLSVMWRVENATNATSIAVKAASGALFLEGKRALLGPEHARENNKSAVTTETNILTIKNATTYNGLANRSLCHIRALSIAANKSGTISGVATVRLIKNTTLGGSPSYTTTNGTTADNGATITSGQSISSYDTAGTTITGGQVVFAASVVVGGNSFFNLDDLDVLIAPSDTLTISFSSDDSCTCSAAITWSEDL